MALGVSKSGRSRRESGGGGRTLPRVAIGLVCLGLFLVLRIFNPLPAERLRDSSIGWAIEIARDLAGAGARVDKPDVVIVDIDEAAIGKYGRWPLPRNVLAQLVDAVRAGAPASVGFAYVFTGSSDDPALDRRLERSLTGGRIVLGTAQFRSRQGFDGGGLPSLSLRGANIDALDGLPSFRDLMPIPGQFVRAAAGAGLLSIQLSHNGIPRRLPTLVRHRGGFMASLPVEMLRVASGVGSITVTGGSAGLNAISIGERSIPTDPDGTVWFAADRDKTPSRRSALDVLEGRVERDEFRSNYVLIGSTAAGLSADHVAADGSLLPGLDALAYALSDLVKARTYNYPAASFLLELVLAVVVVVVACVGDRTVGTWAFLALGAATLAALWASVIASIAVRGELLDPGLLSVLAGLLYGAMMLNRYRLEKRDARAAISQKEREVSMLRQDTARVAVAAANPRLSIALSHELRQPLAAARNYLGAIRRIAGRDQADGVDRLSTYADEASRQISSMTEIMNELSEIVRGDLTLMKEDKLDAVLLEAVTGTISAAGDPDVRLIVDISSTPPAVLLNRRQIQLVVSNLARNAIEAPRPRQRLSITVAVRAVDDDWVEVSVADDAAGIPDALRDHIFMRFESSKSKGSGIGLALCRDIVEAHGGKIRFDTAPGGGTTFFFTLQRSA